MSTQGSPVDSHPARDSTLTEGASNCHWKPDKRALNIDFEYLEGLLFETEPNCGEISRPASFHKPPRAFSSPGHSRLILHSSSTNSIFHATEFKDLERSEKDLREIFSQNDAWWLDMQNPSEHELRQICAAFNIHPLTVEDIWKREASEKIEEYPSYRFACFRSFHELKEDNEITYEPYTIYLIVFSQGTLSFCFDESEHSVNVERRITRFEDLVSIKSDWIFYAFVDNIVDSFVPSIAQVEKKVNQIDDQVYTTRKDDMKDFLWQIESIRKRVLSLIRLLGGKDNVLRGFENHHTAAMNSDQDILLYINDVQDHITAMLSNLHQFEGLLSRSKTNYLAQLEAATLTDKIRVFKFLSRMAVLSLILTLITLTSNTFGVNVDEDNGLFNGTGVGPFFGIVFGEIVLAVALFFLARRYEMWW